MQPLTTLDQLGLERGDLHIMSRFSKLHEMSRFNISPNSGDSEGSMSGGPRRSNL